MFDRGAGMKRIVTRTAAVAATALAILAAGPGCKDKAGDAAINVKAATGGAFEPMPGATAPPSAAPPGDPEPEFRVAAPSASASASEPVDPNAKVFDCGAKGQKLCPMQKWMKTVMAGASSSDDGAKLAAALTYVADHPPPGFATWAAISSDGAKKAKADDIDGAKVSCKQCHDLFKKKYIATMRDRPF
jgi:hypothetical protein